MNFHAIDFAIIGAYFLLIIVLGWLKGGKQKDEDYLLMGRKLTMPGFLLPLCRHGMVACLQPASTPIPMD